MNKVTYEVLFIIPAKYAENELQPIKQLVIDAIKKHDGEITKEDTLGKRKLAYPIKHIYHGYYFYYLFDIQPSRVPEVNQILRHTPELLRHIIVLPTPLDEKAQARLRASAQEETKATESEQQKDTKDTEETPEKKEYAPRKIKAQKAPEITPAPIEPEVKEEVKIPEEKVEIKEEETIETPKKRTIKKKEETIEVKAPKKKEKKMTLEELDKSLDEILKDDII